MMTYRTDVVMTYRTDVVMMMFRDDVVIITYRSDGVVMMYRVGDIRDASIAVVDALYADGKTALYKAVAYALDQLNAIRASQTVSGLPKMNFALVVRGPLVSVRPS